MKAKTADGGPTQTLYVSDLDGTLLRDDATLSPFSESTLRELLAEGLLFTVASARSVVSMKSILGDLPLRLPVIEFNGAFLSDYATGRHQVVHSLEQLVVESVYGHILHHRLAPFVSTFNGVEDCVHYGPLVNDGMHWYWNDCQKRQDRRWRAAPDLRDCLAEKVVCLTVIGEGPALEDLRAAILDAHAGGVETHLFENQYSPGWHWLTVHDRRATKDQAIRILAESCGLGGCQVVAFGDHLNDLKMLRSADRAVAVANAREELKQHAHQVIGSNQEDSVVRFLLAERHKCGRGTAMETET